MSGPAATPVVWVGPAVETDAQARALGEWARARGLRLVEPEPAGERATVRVDLSIADKVEADLDRARDAVNALDGDAADRSLARAEALLLDHPELPQAAMLLAEVERGWAARFARVAPVDADRAARAWAQATALDGGRAPGISEPVRVEAPEMIDVTLVFETKPEQVVRVDGVAATAGPQKRAAGRHQITISLSTGRGGTLWAAWVTLAAGATVRVAPPPAPACTTDDLSRAALRDDGSIAADGVSCAHWVLAAPAISSASAARVASCEGARCGPLVEWRGPDGWSSSPPVPPTVPGGGGGGWPAWATWTLVGGGALIVTGVVLIAAGAFKSAPTETHFVNGGINSQALRLSF